MEGRCVNLEGAHVEAAVGDSNGLAGVLGRELKYARYNLVNCVCSGNEDLAAIPTSGHEQLTGYVVCCVILRLPQLTAEQVGSVV